MYENDFTRREVLHASSICLVLIALAITGCGGSSGDVPVLDANGCEKVSKPAGKSTTVERPTKVLNLNEQHFVKIDTNCGDFTVQLDAKNNPRTAASFAHLAEEGLYDDTWFHRIVEGFVIQGGDPTGDGTGGSGYDISEPPRGKYRVGTVAMAKSGSDPSGTSSSQFYVVIGVDGTDLPPEYAIAGTVSSGMDTVMKIARYAPDPGAPDDSPTGVAVIKSASYQATP